MLNYQSVTVPHGERHLLEASRPPGRPSTSAWAVAVSRILSSNALVPPRLQHRSPNAPLGAVTRKEYHGETAESVVAKPSRVI